MHKRKWLVCYYGLINKNITINAHVYLELTHPLSRPLLTQKMLEEKQQEISKQTAKKYNTIPVLAEIAFVSITEIDCE